MKNKILSMLLSLAIAIGLWIYMITVVNPEFEKTYRNVQVELINDEIMESRGLVITEYTKSVTLKLKGSRTNLVNLSNDNMIVTANVSAYASVGTHRIAYVPDYPGNVPVSSITVQSHSPDFVTIKVERLTERQIPVELLFSGRVPENFMADETTLPEPQMITVTGPESMVNKIEKAVIPIKLEGQEEDIRGQYAYTLLDTEGQRVEIDPSLMSADVDTVEVNVPIRQLKRVQVLVDVIPGGGLDKSAVSVEPGYIEISGSKQQLKDLESITVGTLDLSEVQKGKEIPSFPITLPGKDLRNETGITEAKVVVDFGDLEHRVITTNKITLINVPDGMTAQLITTNLTIQLRGPKAEVDRVRDTHLKITVDLADAPVGTSNITPTITIADGFEDVGVMDSYTVAVKLSKNN